MQSSHFKLPHHIVERVFDLNDYVDHLVETDPKNQGLFDLRKKVNELRRSLHIPAYRESHPGG